MLMKLSVAIYVVPRFPKRIFLGIILEPLAGFLPVIQNDSGAKQDDLWV